MLEIFSKEKLMHGIERLETVAHKDSTVEDYLMSNPLQTSANDIKNWLFNKKDWSNNMIMINPSLGFLDTTEILESRIKVVKEIFHLFHHIKLMRQYDLMSLIAKSFQTKLNNHMRRSDFKDSKDYEMAAYDIVKSARNVIIDEEELIAKNNDIMPSVAQIFKTSCKQYLDTASKNDKEFLHEEFKMLIVDTFNNVIKNEQIKQTILLFYIRIYSEKCELVRNIDKMLLVYSTDEWNYYQWTRSEIYSFSRKVDKASLWLLEDSQIDDLKLIREIVSDLNKLKKALYFKCIVTEDENRRYTIEFVKKNESKKPSSANIKSIEISDFAQDVYRNLKVYEHLLYFISGNTSLLKIVRSLKGKEDSTEYGLKIKLVNKVFRR